MENIQNVIWLQFGGFFITVLGLGLAGIVYLTRQFNRLADRMGNLEQRQARLEEYVNQRFSHMDQRFDYMEDRFGHVNQRFDRLEASLEQLQDDVKNLREGLQNVEKEQARMLGYLEGRGVMGKAPADVETVA